MVSQIVYIMPPLWAMPPRGRGMMQPSDRWHPAYENPGIAPGAHAPPGSQLTGDILANTFITDNLTQQNEFLMYQARQLKRKGKVFAVWSDQGRLKVKESQGASTKVFRSTDDLRSLCGDDPILHEAPATSQRSEAVSDTSGFTTVSSRRGRSAAKK